LDTAFVATYGHGGPVLCTYAEYEAVEGLSQMPAPFHAPVIEGKAGCYDMHHGIGAGSLGAALAVKHVMEKYNLSGTLKIFGTPAEKTVVGKNIMERQGLFDDMDACISWHPSFETSADRFLSVKLRCNNYTTHTFEGVSAYNAMPWAGKNALHAMELMDVAVQFVKDAVIPSTQFPIMASIIDKAYVNYGVSSVPQIAKSTYVSRALSRKDHELIQKKLFDCADAAGLALGVNVKNEVVNGTWEGVPNRTLANLAHKNIEVIGSPKFTERDLEFGRLIQKNLGLEPSATPFGSPEIPPPPGARPDINAWASTDATLFCFKCPFLLATVNYYLGSFGLPDWSTAALSVTNVAHQTLLTGAKIVATSLIDLFIDPELLDEAGKEYRSRVKDIEWYNPMPAGGPTPKFDPLPDEHYRSLAEAFEKRPIWEGFEPEISERMESVARKVLDELS
ncbi:hypothetical protein ACFLZM_07295, partial [Thermodesulfobacteriota bacterium]